MFGFVKYYGALVYIATYVVGWAWPTFRSAEALSTQHDASDDTQWLTYWLLLAMYSFLEAVLWRGLKYLPLYPTLKLCALAWLALPQTNGATWVFFQGRPYILKGVAFVRTQINYLTGSTVAVSPQAVSSVDGPVLEDLLEKIAAYESILKTSLADDYTAVAAGTVQPGALRSKIESLEWNLHKKAIKSASEKAAEDTVPHCEPAVPVSIGGDPLLE